jgi:aspartate/methionine/tyrosine aminotransferase
MSAQRMENIPFSGIREIFEECSRLERDGVDVIHLEIGRPDFDTPQPIKDAAIAAIDEGQVHYTSNYGIEPLRKGIARKLDRENSVEYDSDSEIITTAGATEAVLVTFLTFVNRGDKVLIPDPAWTYASGVHLANGTPVRYRLDPDSGFQPSLKSLEEAVSPDTELLVINSPHNPTGGVVDQDRAEAIRDFAVEHNLVVLSDEIYEKILYEGTHHSLAAVDGMRERTVTVNGFSKAYSMTGWRLGYLAAPEALVDLLIRTRQYTTTCAPSISQHAGVRALEGNLHQSMVETFERRRDLVVDRLASIPGMELSTPPAGALYAFPSVPEGVGDEREFALSLLQETGVALVPGSVFGESGTGRVRIAYSNSTERIDEAFDRIEEWLAG